MGLFDDLLIGGAGLAFVEHEHTKHQRQRFEQQYALEQQQAQYQNGGMQGQYRSAGPSYGAPQQGPYMQQQPMQYTGCCPNCGYSLANGMQGGYQYGGPQQTAGYQPPAYQAPAYRSSPPLPPRTPERKN
jgi:hypothetical protein